METRIEGFDRKEKFTVLFDEEWLNQLRSEAQITSTSMIQIIERRLKGSYETEEKLQPMSPEFVKKWVRYPQVFRSAFVSNMKSLGKHFRILYVANMSVNTYRGHKDIWDEQLEGSGIALSSKVRDDFVDIFTRMADLLCRYHVLSKDNFGKYIPPSEQRLDEFVDNDMYMGEWWDDCYEREDTSKPEPKPESEPKPYVEEEDTFDF